MELRFVCENVNRNLRVELNLNLNDYVEVPRSLVLYERF